MPFCFILASIREGKTVKAPVDGIGFVVGAKPPRMLAAHHTTCKRDHLRKKWLHDPATVLSTKENMANDACL